MKAPQKHVLCLLFAATAAVSHTAVWAHAVLRSATPAKDAEVTSAPKEVTLHFNEKLEAAFSTAKVVDNTGKAVSTERATLNEADPSIMEIALPSLGPGKYTVQFTAVGHDGHRRKGDYAFTVK